MTADWEAFGREILHRMLDHSCGGDLEGGDVQDIGVKHGTLIEITMAAPCSEHSCICAEVSDFPTTCLRIAGSQ